MNWDENTPSDRNNGTSGEKCEEVERLLVELFGDGEVENHHSNCIVGLKEYKYDHIIQSIAELEHQNIQLDDIQSLLIFR